MSNQLLVRWFQLAKITACCPVAGQVLLQMPRVWCHGHEHRRGASRASLSAPRAPGRVGSRGCGALCARHRRPGPEDIFAFGRAWSIWVSPAKTAVLLQPQPWKTPSRPEAVPNCRALDKSVRGVESASPSCGLSWGWEVPEQRWSGLSGLVKDCIVR